MGNTNLKEAQNGQKGQLTFHDVHSENVRISSDGRVATRFESFCKGICFSARPVSVGERVHINFTDVSTSWSGVLRFGFTSHDPSTLRSESLPRYACPDLTSKPGYWAKALNERYATTGNELSYFVTKNGDVMYAINDQDKGIFFSGVNTSSALYVLLDIYGNSVSVEFVNGYQPESIPAPYSGVRHSISHSEFSTRPSALAASGSVQSVERVADGSARTAQQIPLRYHAHARFAKAEFHHITGKNIKLLSTKRNIAQRISSEYCNAYVFLANPLSANEKLVIQVLATDKSYHGALAFGMTSCDPATVRPEALPDDSDLLLDRKEYWVVNKDVCPNADTGDELSFALSEEGEVIYGKNGNKVATLMYVDRTLPLWPFFDVYGFMVSIKLVGITALVAPVPQASSVSENEMNQQIGLMTVQLPPRAARSQTSVQAVQDHSPPPPPVPPPRLQMQRSQPLPSSMQIPSPVSAQPTPVASTARALPAPLVPLPRQRSSPAGVMLPTTSLSPAQSQSTSLQSSSASTTLPQVPEAQPPVPAPRRSPAPPQVQETRHPPPRPQHRPTMGLSTSGHIVPQSSTTQQMSEAATLQSSPAGDSSATSAIPEHPLDFLSRQSEPLPVEPHVPRASSAAVTHDIRKLDLSKSSVTAPKSEPLTLTTSENIDTPVEQYNSTECQVCYERDIDSVLYTCGHMCMCFNCALDVKRTQGECPMCRQPIRDVIRTYKS